MKQELYEYQDRGADWLARARRGYLADGAGLGKTIQACVAAKRAGVRNALVIVPAAVLDDWRAAWSAWGPDVPVAFESYSRLVVHGGVELVGSDWDLVILDEAHYVKTNTAQRTREALRLALGAERTWLLSATPMPNHPGELYPIVSVVWPEIKRELGIDSYQEWFNRFTLWTQTRYGPRPYGTRNLDQLKPYLQRIMLRRRLGDPEVDLVLPPLRIDVQRLTRDGSFEQELAAMGVDGEALFARMMAEENDEDGSTSRLRRLIGEYKAPRIAGILRDELEARAYPKIVVMAHHRSTLAIFNNLLGEFGVTGFDGDTPQSQRTQRKKLFNEDPSIRVFVAQQQAAGVGINLQASSEIVLAEPSSVPSENYQILKRVHRIGSTDRVRARIFAVAHSLDEAYLAIAARKLRDQKELGL